MINEHDIHDFPGSPYEKHHEKQYKKLYELENNTWFVFAGYKYLFVKPDGMYAVIEDYKGNRGNIHMACEVEVLGE